MNGSLHWLPDSSALVFSSNYGREFTGIARHDLATGQLTWVAGDETADLAGHLSPDGTVLLVERNDDGASVLSLRDAGTGSHRAGVPLPAAGCIANGRIPPPAWTPDSRAVAFSVTGAELPGDVLLADGRSGAVTQVTRSAAGLGGARPSVPEQHQVRTPDGETVPCLVYRGAPPADPALAGSAVLVVHGGPEAQARQDFSPYVQLLAAAGHTVLVPNVRGSVGYGKRWYSLDDVERRLDSVADLAALHAYLPQLGPGPGPGRAVGRLATAATWCWPGWRSSPGCGPRGSTSSGSPRWSPSWRTPRPTGGPTASASTAPLARDRAFLHAASPLTRITRS